MFVKELSGSGFESSCSHVTFKKLPFMRLIWRSSKNIYNLLSIMLHITPLTLMLMLHIRHSIYLVLTNFLSTLFLLFHVTFDEISTTLSHNSDEGRCAQYMWSNDIFVLWTRIYAIFHEDR